MAGAPTKGRRAGRAGGRERGGSSFRDQAREPVERRTQGRGALLAGGEGQTGRRGPVLGEEKGRGGAGEGGSVRLELWKMVRGRKPRAGEKGGQGQRGSEAPWHGASGQVMPLGNAREEKPAGRSVPSGSRGRAGCGDGEVTDTRAAGRSAGAGGLHARRASSVASLASRIAHRTLLLRPAMVEGESDGGPASRQTSHGAHPARLSSRSLLSRPRPLVLFPQPPTTRTR